MLAPLLAALLVSTSGLGGQVFRWVHHWGGDGWTVASFERLATRFAGVSLSSDDDDDESPDAEEDGPATPVPPEAPAVPGAPSISGDAAIRISESGAVRTVALLHRIAQAAGWSVTLVGSPRETIDVSLKDVPAEEALRTVLQKSGAMGVLKRDRLVVVASPDHSNSGLLVQESQGSRRHRHEFVFDVPPGARAPAGNGRNRRGSHDLVRIFQGDLTVSEGQIVQGDVVCIGGSIDLEPGSVVRGDAVAIGGSVSVSQGALVLGEAVALLGKVDVQRGAQVMGEHVQVGPGAVFGRHRRSSVMGLGPFGLFPTLALFALTYLLGLLALRLWPERVRTVGDALAGNPLRSFAVGFLCWLLLLPLVLLLLVSIVGIPLVPLLPVVLFLSVGLGLSAIALRIGESLPAGPGERFVPPAALGMGMLVLLLLSYVPWLGISLLALVQFFALGAAVSSRYGRAVPPHV